MKIEMTQDNGPSFWREVNDGVMGGKSSGGPAFTQDRMIFKGVINTDGGGFSSIRANVEPESMTGYDGIKLRVKSDGRFYKMTFRTDETRRFRRISFQAPIPQTPTGQWSDIYVSFDNLKASIFGRPVSGATFDKSDIRELGIIIADGQDGPFELHLKSMEFCASL